MKKKIFVIVSVVSLSVMSLTISATTVSNFPGGEAIKIENPVKRTIVRTLDYTLKQSASSTTTTTDDNNSTDDNNTDDNNTSDNNQVTVGNNAYKDLNLTEQDLIYLARCVENETSGRGDLTGNTKTSCAMNVACVILNRVLSSRFPSTPYDVITQKSQFSGASRYIANGKYSEDSMNAVKKVLEVGDITDGCEYFLNEAIAGHPSWLNNLNFRFTDDINHSFYHT